MSRPRKREPAPTPRRCIHCGQPFGADDHCPECDPAAPIDDDEEEILKSFPRTGEAWPRSFRR